MKLPSRYLDTLGEEKGKSREIGRGLDFVGNFAFWVFLGSHSSMLLYLCFLVLLPIGVCMLAFGCLSKTGYC